MKLFLTGGTGFFGKSILRKLLSSSGGFSCQRPNCVVVLSRNPMLFLKENPEFAKCDWLSFYKGDVENFSTLPTHESFTHVIHAATDTTDRLDEGPLKRYDQIVIGTRNMLDFALKVGAKRFLFTSSGAVYGRQPNNYSNILESYHGMPDPLMSSNSYGIGKRQAEHLCALYYSQYNLKTVIARCFAFVGPDLPIDAHFAIGNFVRDALYRDSIMVVGDGLPLRSYLYQDDLVTWLFAILERGQAGEAYNVGSDEAISIHDLAKLVRDVIAPSKPIVIGRSSEKSECRNLYVPDITKAKEKLGVTIETPLVDALKKVAQILKA